MMLFNEENIPVFIFGFLAGVFLLLAIQKWHKKLKKSSKKQLKSDILTHHDLIETILESVPVTVSVKGRDFRYIYVNQYQADMLYKCDAEDAIGKTASELINKEYGAYTSKNDQYILDSGSPLSNYQETIEDIHGNKFEVITTKAPIFGPYNTVEAIVTISMDISAQRVAEKNLHKSLAEAKKANASKAIFIASMSHELRTPLNAIIGFSDLILNEVYGKVDNARYHEYIKDIHSSGEHLLTMVNDVLELSKLESKRFKFAFEEYNVVEYSKEIVSRFSRDHSASQVTFSVTSTDNVPETLVANKRMQTQIHLNLLSNALRHVSKETGKIEVHWSVTKQGDLSLEFTDNGSGMDAETIAKIGQPFMLPDEAYHAKNQTVGNGLGLYITKRIIESRGGKFSVESEVGSGSTFKATWPLAIFNSND